MSIEITAFLAFGITFVFSFGIAMLNEWHSRNPITEDEMEFLNAW
ncbi:hypothetical protein [Acetobacter oeni]|nr:hypothetical protein [Acetobacter oeni]MBB3883814.1 hypothetical protein [Acetobacter oeni]